MIRAVFLSVCLFAAAANSTFAQAPPPTEWQSLSSEQQHLLQSYQDKWSGLPPERQRFGQWRSMPPEQRQELRNRWQQFKSLPPEQQQRVRQSFQRFRQMPPEQRTELRRQWRQMSPEQRQSVIRPAPPPRPPPPRNR